MGTITLFLFLPVEHRQRERERIYIYVRVVPGQTACQLTHLSMSYFLFPLIHTKQGIHPARLRGLHEGDHQLPP